MAALPVHLAHSGQLLLADVAIRYHANPLLDLPEWGLQDLGVHPAEFRLTEAVGLDLAASYAEAKELVDLFCGAAIAAYSSSIHRGQAFWRVRESLWQGGRAEAASNELDGERLLAEDRRVVLSKVVGAALDSVAGRSEVLTTALGHYGAALSIESDLHSLQVDLASGFDTIATVAAYSVSAGADDPALAYLLAAGHRIHHRLLDRALEEAELARQGVEGLPLLSVQVSELMGRLRATRQMLDDHPPAPARPLPRASRRRSLTTRAKLAAERAGEFLLAEIDQAREVQRRDGIEMTSTFPMSFPLEALARNGLPVGDRLESWMLDLARRSFAYYDYPRFSALDSDTVGAVLRLSSYLPDHGTEVVDQLVARVEQAVAQSDRIPVWLEKPGDPSLRLTGERCGAVEANLLLGLVQAVPKRFKELGAQSFARLRSEFASLGCAISADYVSEYLLVPLARLLSSMGVSYREVLSRIQQEIEKRATTTSAQTAAFLVLAVGALPTLEFETARWVEAILRAQRHDGGFEAEPLFWVNGAGSHPEWFQNRGVTTAFCYDALSTWLRSEGSSRP